MAELVDLIALECADCWMDSETRTQTAMRDYFAEHSRFALAFNGDMCSSLLLYLAVSSGCDVKAYIAALPGLSDTAAALKAESFGAKAEIVHPEMPGAAAMYEAITAAAKVDGYSEVIDGRCASGSAGTSDGASAALKAGVRSPLFLARAWKPEVFAISKKFGIGDGTGGLHA